MKIKPLFIAAMAAALGAAWIPVQQGSVPDLVLFAGRFHPLTVHMPIGFLIIAFLMELFSRRQGMQHLGRSVGFVLGFGAAAAIAAAALGYMLSLGDGYGGVTLDRHKFSGIALAVVASLLWLLRRRMDQRQAITPFDQRIYFGLFGLTMLLMTVTGHLGGTLTHGSSWYARYAPDFLKPLLGGKAAPAAEMQAMDPQDAVVFAHIIQPILDDNCLSCHNPEKKKGGLLLDTIENIKKGGESGVSIVPGDAEDSELYFRITLPEDDEEHMPPEGKRQPTKDQVRLIGWWLDSGASFDAKLRDVEVPEDVQPILDKLHQAGAEAEPEFPQVEPVDEKVIAKLNRDDLVVLPIAENLNVLQARLIRIAEASAQADVTELKPVANQLVWLNLAGTDLTNSQLGALPAYRHMRRLHLERTDIGDSALVHVGKLPELRYLNLYGTNISDNGLVHLANLKNLRQLYIWQTRVTDAGISALKSKLPELDIVAGVSQSAFADSSVKLGAPAISYSQALLTQAEKITLEYSFRSADIRYTLDGSEPTLESPKYEGPLSLSRSCTLRARTFAEGWQPSEIVEAVFLAGMHEIAGIELKTPLSEKYPGGGPQALIDLKQGKTDYKDTPWLGWENQDLQAVLDLGESREVSRFTLSIYQDVGAWIFPPKRIRVYASTDGKRYTKIGDHRLQVPTDKTPISQELVPVKLKPGKARYVRVAVTNFGLGPKWHAGSGRPVWLFVDEMILE